MFQVYIAFIDSRFVQLFSQLSVFVYTGKPIMIQKRRAQLLGFCHINTQNKDV